jgi:DNA-binding FadR family transcriptional regulator
MAGTGAARRAPEPPPETAALRAPKTSELIADWVRDYIRRNRLNPGDPLPTEEELKRRFAASRPTVREAMRILEVRQLVRITRGATGGARYHVPAAGMVAEHIGIYLEAHRATQGDLTVARLSIEPSIIGFVAESAAMRDIVRLQAAVDRQAGLVHDQAGFAEAHEAFYGVLADICENITLAMLVRILRELMHAQMETMGNSLMFEGESALKDRRDHVRAKSRLMEFLRVRDRDGAEKWWRRHLRAQLERVKANGHAGIMLRAPRRSGEHG